jgi:hypothetical protein
MLGIMRKDGFYFLLSAGVIAPLVLIAEGWLLPGYTVTMLLANLLMMFLLVAGPVAIVEQAEEKNNGYAWLGTLPVRRREIVAAKFLMAFLTLAAVVAGNLIQVHVLVTDPEPARLLTAVVLLNGAACLVMAGLMYTGILGIGYTRFLMAVSFVMVLLGLVPPFLMMSKTLNLRDQITAVRAFLLQLDAGLVIAAGVLVYGLFFLLAIRMLRFTPREKGFSWMP